MSETLQTPYLKSLEENLSTQRNMLTLLQAKVDTLKKMYPDPFIPAVDTLTKTWQQALEHIDADITIIRTHGEIDVLKRIINEKEKYYQGYAQTFQKDLEEADKKLKHTIDIAKRSTKQIVMRFLATPDIFNIIDRDVEARVEFYKKLRKHV